VGTKLAENFADESKWAKYLAKVWTAIGTSAVQNIQDQLGAIQFKNSTGRLQRAVSWKSYDWGVLIYMDKDIAPHALWQEIGVKEHTMTYLLKAAGPIPVPTGHPSPHGIAFRPALEKWMGVPHQYKDSYDGSIKWATGWVHPGYEGKYFFRDGIKNAVKDASQRLRGVIFEMAAED